jgi:hypothetical protein
MRYGGNANMRLWKNVWISAVVAAALGLSGCWVAAGAGAAAAGYEYKNKQSLDRLDRDYKAGKISEREYFRMKQEIENGSLVY